MWDVGTSITLPNFTDAYSVIDVVNIKILNAGAWARGAERVPVSLPRELEDFIPEVEEFYRGQHSGRRLQWHHHWSNGVVMFANEDGGRYELEVTTFQMAVLFCWNDRPHDHITYENLRLATELPDMELRRTLWVCCFLGDISDCLEYDNYLFSHLSRRPSSNTRCCFAIAIAVTRRTSRTAARFGPINSS